MLPCSPCCCCCCRTAPLLSLALASRPAQCAYAALMVPATAAACSAKPCFQLPVLTVAAATGNAYRHNLCPQLAALASHGLDQLSQFLLNSSCTCHMALTGRNHGDSSSAPVAGPAAHGVQTCTDPGLSGCAVPCSTTLQPMLPLHHSPLMFRDRCKFAPLSRLYTPSALIRQLFHRRTPRGSLGTDEQVAYSDLQSANDSAPKHLAKPRWCRSSTVGNSLRFNQRQTHPVDQRSVLHGGQRLAQRPFLPPARPHAPVLPRCKLT
jgi:hypothetical protein